MKAKFGTAVSCIDGRVQLPIINWVKENFRLDYVDMVTVPGSDKIATESEPVKEFIRRAIETSVQKHESALVVVTGHYDCAGNPVGEKEHRKMINMSIEEIKKWGLPVEVTGAWVNSLWEVERL